MTKQEIVTVVLGGVALALALIACTHAVKGEWQPAIFYMLTALYVDSDK